MMRDKRLERQVPLPFPCRPMRHDARLIFFFFFFLFSFPLSLSLSPAAGEILSLSFSCWIVFFFFLSKALPSFLSFPPLLPGFTHFFLLFAKRPLFQRATFVHSLPIFLGNFCVANFRPSFYRWEKEEDFKTKRHLDGLHTYGNSTAQRVRALAPSPVSFRASSAVSVGWDLTRATTFSVAQPFFLSYLELLPLRAGSVANPSFFFEVVVSAIYRYDPFCRERVTPSSDRQG